MEQDVRRQIGLQVLGHADGTYARTATAVRDGKGLVQVEVADIGTNVSGTGQTDLGVHDGTHSSFLQAFTAQHLDVAVGDGEDLGATERSGRNSAFLLFATAVEQDV